LPRSGANDALRAEILIVERREDEARELLASAEPQPKVLYLRALINGEDATDTTPYLRARLRTYRDNFALAHVEEALREAETIADRIDALLDRVYALFASGRWPEARRAALEALADVEETQGDRAAGGLLFLLAFLCADEGEEAHAAQRINRLRHFYSSTDDARHLAEIELLNARLDLSRGRFDAAQRAAKSLLTRDHDVEIAEAAAMIVDAVDFIEKRPVARRAEPRNIELRRRHHYLRGNGTLEDDHPLKRLAPNAVKPLPICEVEGYDFLNLASASATGAPGMALLTTSVNSAPWMRSSGSMTLPFTLLIFSPVSSTMSPERRTRLNGTSFMKWRPIIIIRATQKKRMS